MHNDITTANSCIMSLRVKRSNLKLSLADITGAMELDKKIRDKAIRWVLLEDIGEAVIRSDVPNQDVLEVLEELTLA